MFDATTYHLPNWEDNPQLEPEVFRYWDTYDALGRPVQEMIGRSGLQRSTIVRTYDPAGLLKGIMADCAERGSKNYVTQIDYNEKGHRTGITFGNGTRTTYTYEAATYRLSVLRTVRATETLQELHYHYDGIGNIVAVDNTADDVHFFNNQNVSPSKTYEYDALYRLCLAHGREHAGLSGSGAALPDDQWDAFRTNLPHPGDGRALQRYRRQYRYDAAGNMRTIKHIAGLGALTHRYTKTFSYNNNDGDRNALGVPSTATKNNRLLRYSVGTDPQQYAFDAHGNMSALAPNAADDRFEIDWDSFDRLAFLQLANQGTAHYRYGSNGQRERKLITDGNKILKERIHAGALEVYREYRSDGTVKIERESFHITDGSRRIAMVDTKTVDDPSDRTQEQLSRYQYSNHLGSSALELDDRARVISYEEYYPYGTTAYQAVGQSIAPSAKRYRYTGMERDEESGLNYHSARYYLPWSARWLNTDPIGIAGGINLYAYVYNNPVKLNDPSGTHPPDDEEPQQPAELEPAEETETVPEAERQTPDRPLNLQLDPEWARQMFGPPILLPPIDPDRLVPLANRPPSGQPLPPPPDVPQLPLRSMPFFSRLLYGIQQGAATFERNAETRTFDLGRSLQEDETRFRLMIGEEPETPEVGATLASAGLAIADNAGLVDQVKEAALGPLLPLTITGVAGYLVYGAAQTGGSGDGTALTGVLNNLSGLAPEIPLGDNLRLRLPGSAPITTPANPEGPATDYVGLGLGLGLNLGTIPVQTSPDGPPTQVPRHQFRLDTNSRININGGNSRFNLNVGYQLTF